MLPVALLTLAVVVLPIAIVVPPVTVLPLAIVVLPVTVVVPPVAVLPLAAVVPPVTIVVPRRRVTRRLILPYIQLKVQMVGT